MTVSIRRLAPVAHLPLVLGVLRKLEVARLIDEMIPPNPAHVVSCGRGVEALVLAILRWPPCPVQSGPAFGRAWHVTPVAAVSGSHIAA